MNQSQALFLVQSEGSPLFVSPSIRARLAVEEEISCFFDDETEMSLNHLVKLIEECERSGWRNIDDGPNC